MNVLVCSAESERSGVVSLSHVRVVHEILIQLITMIDWKLNSLFSSSRNSSAEFKNVPINCPHRHVCRVVLNRPILSYWFSYFALLFFLNYFLFY